ncbi:MAG: TfoX/Sxy family protein [Bacteroidia bacterium]
MAYDESLANRVVRVFLEKNIEVEEKKMMGGLCFMVDGKMCCGLLMDKKTQENLLMARIGEIAYEQAIEKEECIPMEFTGRAMKGFVFVLEAGFESDQALTYWIDLCLAYNPLAKASKKKA